MDISLLSLQSRFDSVPIYTQDVSLLQISVTAWLKQGDTVSDDVCHEA